MIPVILESPFGSTDAHELGENVRYAQACALDCLRRLEAPFASHLLYPQCGLDDANPEERAIGMAAGFVWIPFAVASVAYTDRGISPGMEEGIRRARRLGLRVEFRTLTRGQWEGERSGPARSCVECGTCGAEFWWPGFCPACPPA